MIFAGLPNINPVIHVPPQAGPVLGTGAAITDFLTGKITQLHQANPNPENLAQNYFALYAQDTWKASRTFTVNYGVRWAPFMPMQFTDANVYTFNLANFYKGVTSTAVPTAPPGFSYPAWTNSGPSSNRVSALPGIQRETEKWRSGSGAALPVTLSGWTCI
jgi:hypothetical protein